MQRLPACAAYSLWTLGLCRLSFSEEAMGSFTGLYLDIKFLMFHFLTMKTSQTTFTLNIYTPEQQGVGSFDGGKITEIKPIPFPRETGGAKRTGPLLYWAWASAKGDGVIGMHPHQGFEIVSYVLEGSVGHTDTAGNNRRVDAGGIQVMQTGSGISHQEEMYGEQTEFFQIWFEPNMRESLQKPAVYSDFEDSEFPRERLENGVLVKHVIGPQGAMKLEAPVNWDALKIDPEGSYALQLDSNSLAAFVVTEGQVQISLGDDNRTLNRRDFAMIKSGPENTLNIKALEESAGLTLITAPLDPGYPLVRL